MIRPVLAALAAVTFAGSAASAQSEFTTDPSAVPAGTYTLDKRHTSLTLKVSHAGFSFYTLRFDGVDGSYVYDPADPERTRLQVSVDPRSIDTGDAAFNQQIASQIFEAAKYPEIKYVSTSVRSAGEGRGTVTGDLTFHGVTKPVTLDVVFNGAREDQPHEERMGFSATGEVRRSDFGVGKDLPGVGDDVSLVIETEFSK